MGLNASSDVESLGADEENRTPAFRLRGGCSRQLSYIGMSRDNERGV